jgi:putative two-component system response regulator
VALADVYDALVTRRVYKGPWSDQLALDYIKDQSGKHFDPAVVDAFLAIYDVIAAIRDKYQEGGSSPPLTNTSSPLARPSGQKS